METDNSTLILYTRWASILIAVKYCKFNVAYKPSNSSTVDTDTTLQVDIDYNMEMEVMKKVSVFGKTFAHIHLCHSFILILDAALTPSFASTM